ncbi:MAG: hypothetical protein HQM13_07095 [SAR324 cluster bacterium]|nr:hypothetical protein [SAR324 cluster bacterium]
MEAIELIEQYYQKGWTDGLPVVPPNENAIKQMLAAAGLNGGDVVAEISLRNTKITAEKIAINAVMAGCLPEYLPVVISAVKGLSHEKFGYHGPATSTGGASIVVIVNGPVAQKLKINSKDNVFGPGCRANMTIGRAIRLLMMNTINTRPGILDRSTLGSPGKISFCFAENERDSAWEALHVERGFAKETSTTTVFAAESAIQVYNQLSNNPEPLLISMADAIANLGSKNIVGQQQVVLVIAGEHMQIMKKCEWSKAKVREFVFAHATRTLAELKKAGRLPGAIEPGDESKLRHAVLDARDLILVSAGGKVGSFSACLPGWGTKNGTQSVTTMIELSQ